jgi:regulatory protein
LTDSPDEAKRYSLRLLSYRARSEKELRSRLRQKGFSERSISPVIHYLKDAKFLDDEALAEQLRRQALEVRMLGFSAARVYMLKKGLPRDVVETALGFDEEEEVGNARKLVDKKLQTMGKHPTADEKKKLWNFLARRGYPSGTIRAALRDIGLEEEE